MSFSSTLVLGASFLMLVFSLLSAWRSIQGRHSLRHVVLLISCVTFIGAVTETVVFAVDHGLPDLIISVMMWCSTLSFWWTAWKVPAAVRSSPRTLISSERWRRAHRFLILGTAIGAGAGLILGSVNILADEGFSRAWALVTIGVAANGFVLILIAWLLVPRLARWLPDKLGAPGDPRHAPP